MMFYGNLIILMKDVITTVSQIIKKSFQINGILFSSIEISIQN